MSLKWTIRLLLLALPSCSMPHFASGACNSTTCLNQGTCDPSYTGTGFRCKCPTEGKVDYGPRCELLIRGYLTSSPGDNETKFTMTKHDLSGHTFYPNSLSISFEFVAHCHRPPCKFFVIKDANSEPLVTIEVIATGASIGTDYLRIWMPEPGMNHSDPGRAVKIALGNRSRDDWIPHWQALSIRLLKNGLRDVTTRSLLCSLKKKECANGATNNYTHADDLRSILKNSTVSIGRFMGCIRNVRVNGALVDLGNVAGYSGSHDTGFTFPFCPSFMFSCQKFNSRTREFQQNYCGKDSQCSGEVKQWLSSNNRTESCTCRCINGKRRSVETVSNSDKCTDFPLPENQCDIDSPIMSLGHSDNRVEWKMQNGGDVNIGRYQMSLEAIFSTVEMYSQTALELVRSNETVPYMYINIFEGRLFACIAQQCFAFPNVSVSDGAWHSFTLSIWGGEMTAMLDMVTQVHVLSQVDTFSGATLRLSLRNSCFRAVRLSNIYMPTGDNDTTADDAANYISVTKGRGVKVGHSCVKCDKKCGQYEECDIFLREPTCSCKTGFARDSLGNCQAPKNCLCELDEDCDLSTGVPLCECMAGYVRDSLGSCTKASHCNCKKHEDCDPTSGMTRCKCRRGFVRNLNGDCELEVKCNCHENEVCDRVSGLPLCKCMNDFVRNSADKCVSADGIATAKDCMTMPSGDVKCTCKDGYVLDSNEKCIFAVSCTSCDLFSECDMSSGMPLCTCVEGFVKDDSGACVASSRFIGNLLSGCSQSIIPSVPALIIALFTIRASLTLLLLSIIGFYWINSAN